MGRLELERAALGCEAVAEAALAAAEAQGAVAGSVARVNGSANDATAITGELALSLERRLEAIAREAAEVAELAQRSLAIIDAPPVDHESTPPNGNANGDETGRAKALSLLVTQMQAQGLDRSEIEARLRADFGLSEPAKALGELHLAGETSWRARGRNGH